MKVRSWLKQSTAIFALFITVQLTAYAKSLPEFTELVEEASPAVVNISTLQLPKQNRMNRYYFPDDEIPDIFQEFFGRPHPQRPAPGGKPRPQSLGSGFIISEDGYILTNNHVVKGADQIIVRLSDRRELEAKLIGADKRSDLALLKIKAKNLPTVELGTTDNLKPGQWVIAIGSPFGFDYSVTAGIISAINRSLPSENYVPFIQTDVAINPGNSGGPLFDMDGKVIGVNSQIFTRSGGFMGLSFAIPIDVVMNVVSQLKDKGYVSRGWLGVYIQDVNKDLAESFGLDKPHGALVAEVLPEGPADEAGFKPGDIITQFAEREIDVSADLPHAVGQTPVGKKVPVEVVRQGNEITLDVTIGELPDEKGKAHTPVPAKSGNRLGLQVEDLTDEQKRKYEVSNGVIVTGVLVGPASSVGIRRGDIITDLHNQPVNSVRDFKQIMAKLPTNRSVSMRLVRNARPGYITFKLTE
ncbi:DegQ family serine endoprotease [Endozoicomonas sp. SM1973]|uniref:Probable periplasmic serine endoprotease DegP-like n=1 Tax=Spartinivicinus marinus TaxID=2994442 RepID=A0A853I7T0_9GAMM|nr:DegQ family serine endoprotease [Spartinivicinus marinus]MCX4025496.1 DegQ family serine endoprotease [Spartinivicinus marinus]NYZ65275.1 DegQ family serine endoprotease [Spartinivicinus marinus]